MVKTVKARFKKGVIEPLEKIELEEGQEITVTITAEEKLQKVVALGGLWAGVEISDEAIEEVTKGWEQGLKKQEAFLMEEETE